MDSDNTWAAVGLASVASTVTAVIVKVFKVTSSVAKQLIVLGVTIILAIGAKLSGSLFTSVNWIGMLFLIIAAVGAANMGYAYVAKPVEKAVKASKTAFKRGNGASTFAAKINLFKKVINRRDN